MLRFSLLLKGVNGILGCLHSLILHELKDEPFIGDVILYQRARSDQLDSRCDARFVAASCIIPRSHKQTRVGLFKI